MCSHIPGIALRSSKRGLAGLDSADTHWSKSSEFAAFSTETDDAIRAFIDEMALERGVVLSLVRTGCALEYFDVAAST